MPNSVVGFFPLYVCKQPASNCIGDAHALLLLSSISHQHFLFTRHLLAFAGEGVYFSFSLVFLVLKDHIICVTILRHLVTKEDVWNSSKVFQAADIVIFVGESYSLWCVLCRPFAKAI